MESNNTYETLCVKAAEESVSWLRQWYQEGKYALLDFDEWAESTVGEIESEDAHDSQGERNYIFAAPNPIFLKIIFVALLVFAIAAVRYEVIGIMAALFSEELKQTGIIEAGITISILVLNIGLEIYILKTIRFRKRYKLYCKNLKQHEIELIDDLSDEFKIKKQTVIKDLKKAVNLDLIPEGKLGKDELFFIVSQEAYNRYIANEERYISYYKEQAAKSERGEIGLIEARALKETIENCQSSLLSLRDTIEDRKVRTSYKSVGDSLDILLVDVDSMSTSTCTHLCKVLDFYKEDCKIAEAAYNDIKIKGLNIEARRNIKKTIIRLNEWFMELFTTFYQDAHEETSGDNAKNGNKVNGVNDVNDLNGVIGDNEANHVDSSSNSDSKLNQTDKAVINGEKATPSENKVKNTTEDKAIISYENKTDSTVAAEKTVIRNTDDIRTYFGIKGDEKELVLDFKDCDISKLHSLSFLFQKNEQLESLKIINLDFSEIYSMVYIFSGCKSLINLDVSSWNVSNVTDMHGMFDGCNALQNLDVSSWNVSNVTDMHGMFNGCNALQNLDVSSWNVSNVTNMSWLFNRCNTLQGLDLSLWNVSNVTDMSWMFNGCNTLQELDLSLWNVSNVTDMSWMFSGCKSLQLIKMFKGNFYKGSVSTMKGIFSSCDSLKTIVLDTNDELLEMIIIEANYSSQRVINAIAYTS